MGGVPCPAYKYRLALHTFSTCLSGAPAPPAIMAWRRTLPLLAALVLAPLAHPGGADPFPLASLGYNVIGGSSDRSGVYAIQIQIVVGVGRRTDARGTQALGTTSISGER